MNTLTLDSFKKALQSIYDETENPKFLLAVSGGADSMVLLWLFTQYFSKQSAERFQVAHINYKLRGEDSESDQKVVENFCKKNGIKCHIYTVSEKDNLPKNSIQLWARELRYQFFRKIQKGENLDFLVTAHHLNDELETFFINLSRGSGLNGLSGMPRNENGILRPLLSFSKEEIYAFAAEKNIGFREDKSNKKSDYLRNKIRNEIVPKLMETNAFFLNNFKKSIQILSQSKDFITDEINEIQRDLTLKKEENFLVLDKEKLSCQAHFVKFEVMKRFGFQSHIEIQKIFLAEKGKIFFTEDFSVLVDRKELIISKKLKLKNESEEEILLKINDKNEIKIPQNIAQEILEFGKIDWVFDESKVKTPLVLRKNISNDWFFPVGMMGKKKVSKFFKDQKLSILSKSKIWVLYDDEGRVLGVLPFRQDRRSVATENTENKIYLFLE